MIYQDKYTWKQTDRPRWSDFGTPNGTFCEVCGTECIDRCINCGAPQCCPKCCHDTKIELKCNMAMQQNKINKMQNKCRKQDKIKVISNHANKD